MPSEEFLHQRRDFKALAETVAQKENIQDPALVEKDYWIMHAVYGLKQLGLKFELKGGTSLSKGFGVIHRFSEDIDIRIEPFDGLQVATGPNHDKSAHIESRRTFFEKLKEKLHIPGIIAVERDASYDDEKLRNAALRLRYNSFFGSVPGLKDGVLLEVGFDQTTPYRLVTISSWIAQFGQSTNLTFIDNRAQEIPCYNAEYTFVEKLQTVVKKFRQFRETGDLKTNFLRHYYDIHQLLELDDVQKFIGTDEYLEHKKKRFKSENQNIAESGAFTLDDQETRKRFEGEYVRTAALYYRGQVPLADILARIQRDLARL
jgi:hypothetical protein